MFTSHVDVPAQGGESIEDLFHRPTHAVLVDAAHIVNGHAASYDMVFLGSIDGSHAELDNPRGIDHRHLMAQRHQVPGTMTSNNGDRHAVDVA
jgi:hypothetical protein